MGSGGWSSSAYASTTATRIASGTTFSYSSTMKAAPITARTAHSTLDVKGVNLRESRDSDEHPTSTAITVLFDVTGSMGGIPIVLQQKLPGLFGLLLRKGYIDHPQVMLGGIGDATCDRVPIQISQWESDNRVDEALDNLFLEGGGGGQQTESYELAMYFMAYHTEMDCLVKRGKRGYLFIIGDEMAYSYVDRMLVEQYLGQNIQSNIKTEDVVRDLQKKFEVFFIIPSGASNASDPVIEKYWRNLFGQNVIIIDDPAAICETIALQIGLAEGNIDLDEGLDDLDEFGADENTKKAVSRAVVKAGSGKVAKTNTDLDFTPAGADEL